MNAFNPERVIPPEFKESEPKPASIRLEFFRHDAKMKESSAGARPNDATVRLTSEGRRHATEVGKVKEPESEVSIAYASPRDRALETALRHMLANEDRLTDDSSLEDIRTLIEAEVGYGQKHITTEKLDFGMDGNQEFHDVAYDHYLIKKDFLPWLRSDSDSLAKKLHDTESTTYSRMAGNVAELVKKYVQILPRWQSIVASDPTTYQKFNNELQRHFGSHQGVTESFLMKVIEKTEGREGVDNFINSLGSKNGFDFSEGFSVQVMGEDDLQLLVRFRDKEWSVTPTFLDDLILERDELNAELDDSQ